LFFAIVVADRGLGAPLSRPKWAEWLGHIAWLDLAREHQVALEILRNIPNVAWSTYQAARAAYFLSSTVLSLVYDCSSFPDIARDCQVVGITASQRRSAAVTISGLATIALLLMSLVVERHKIIIQFEALGR
jgi:hypothetical protein